METYRLNSKLVENEKEYVIQTTNDISLGMVATEVYVDGVLTDSIKTPHPDRIKPEEIMSLVQNAHGEKKSEIESLLNSIKRTLDSTNPEAILHLGLAFYFKRFSDEAKSLLKHVITLDTGNHEAYNFLGQVELSLGNANAAVSAAKVAVDMKPEYADYRNNLGEALLATKSYRNAVMEFERAIDINLYYSDAYFNYGLTLLKNALEKQDTDLFANFISKSYDYFSKAAIINQEYKSLNYENGLLLLKEQKVLEAFELLKRVRENLKKIQRQKSAPYYMKHVLQPDWISEKAIADRIRFLQKEIEKNPTYVDLYAELSRCYLNQSQMIWKKGIDQYKKTINLNPGYSKLKDYLAEAEITYDAINHVVKKITN